MNTLDILFLVTIVLLVLNGLRNGAVFSLIHFVALPAAFAGAALFGPSLTSVLAAHHLPATPLALSRRGFCGWYCWQCYTAFCKGRTRFQVLDLRCFKAGSRRMLARFRRACLRM